MSAYEWPAGDAAEIDDREGRRAYRRSLGVARRAELAAPEQDMAAAPAPARGRRPRAVQAAPTAPGALWAPIGPASSLGGQTTDNGRVSGRVREVRFEPTKGLRGYAASASGGVWYTADAGASWRALGGFLAAPTTGTRATVNPLVCGALHVEFPSADDPSTDVVWVGTGEGATNADGMPGDELSGVGVLRGEGPATKPASDAGAFVVEATNLAAKGSYRLAVDPAGTVVVATTAGLHARPAGPGPHPAWTLVADHPMTTPDDPADAPVAYPCVDVVATPAAGPTPARLWAAFLDPDTNALVVLRYKDAGAATFVDVDIDDGSPDGITHLPMKVAALAASADGTRVYLLTQGPRLYRVDATAATPQARLVKGTPNLWNGGTDSSKIAVAVDPTDRDRVAVAGTFKKGDNASVSLYCGKLTSAAGVFRFPAEAASFCGEFVHPDIQSIRFQPDGRTVWLTCDGGVYRSTAAGAAGSFAARNDGLAVAEVGWVASHPESDGGVVAGLQDNGTQRRIGETVWTCDNGGDGGGLAFDPIRTHRYVGQYTNAVWSHGLEGPRQPVHRAGHAKATYQKEEDASSFYSAPATIAKDAATTQLAVGTNRVWYTEDWGVTWRTLPAGANTNKDARGDVTKIDDALDALPGTGTDIRILRWETKDRLWAITRRALYRYERDGAGAWTRTEQLVHPLLSRRGKKRDVVGDAPPGGPVAASGSWLDLAVHQPNPAAGKLGTLYLATSGAPKDPTGEQLFWFDGVSTWRAVGLRTRTTAAALAVAVEPGHPEAVYVGTTIGVFKATLTMDGDTPQWDWTRLDNGLPDVAVQDLSVYSRDGVRLLRAGTQARGVWELDLAGPVAPRTYVRVHEIDTRRRLPTPLARPFTAKVPDPANPPALVPVDYAWHASPDVRVHPRLEVVAAPASLPWTRSKHPAAATDPTGVWRLWQLQAALRGLDPRSEPNGTWTTRFDAVLAHAGAPLVGGKRTVNPAFWATVMTPDKVAAGSPWDAPRPSEADLIEWLPDLEPASAADRPSTSVPAGPATVQVLLHDRGFPGAAADKVRVALLRYAFGPWVAQPSAAWATGNVGWTAGVNAFLAGGAAPAPAAPWTFVPATADAVPQAEVAAGSPQAVSFPVDLTGAAPGSLFLFVAVVWSDKDRTVLAERPLRDLTLADPHVAVRSVRVTKP